MGTASGIDRDVSIDAGAVQLEGHLRVPASAEGLVLFAHGSGSGRHSPRNRLVASVLTEAGIGTLLLDLLTPPEEANRENVFDIELLARRLLAATHWVRKESATGLNRVGYFGASTGAGAALTAAATDRQVAAVVSRGGRPDLAGRRLPEVEAPTLLVVGSADTTVLELNRRAQALMLAPTQLAVVEGATHLFEEPGTLEEAARLARDWFLRYLPDEQEAHQHEEQ